MIKITPSLAGLLAALTLSAAVADPAPEELRGIYTQNAPCKGDGSGQADILVKVSPEKVESHVSACTFHSVKQDGNKFDARLECRFPSGPLIGEVSFTIKPNDTVGFIDRDKNYQATLYRCPKQTGSSE